MYAVIPGPRAKKFLKKANTKLRERLIPKIKKLSQEPFPRGCLKVVGEENTYRIRVGDYRVLYEIKAEEKAILIANIDKRPKAYR